MLLFDESWCPSRVCFESTFVHPGNGCSDRTEDLSYVLLMEFLYVDDLVLCRESLNEVMDKYGC